MQLVKHAILQNYRMLTLNTVRFGSDHVRKVMHHDESKINFIVDEIRKNRPLSNHEWKIIRQTALDSGRQINLINVDASILSFCLGEKVDLEIAQSYVNFLQGEGVDINLATMGKLLKMYASSAKNNTLSDEHQKEVYEIYQMLIKKHPLLDANTCDSLIESLSLTKHWQECFKLLDMGKITGNPSVVSYSQLTRACFQNGENDTGWKLMDECIELGKYPFCTTYLAWIDQSKKDPLTLVENIEKMLNFTSDKDILLTRLVGQELKNLFDSLGYSSNFTKVNRRGMCTSCLNQLENISISSEDFQKLTDSFLDKVLIRKNIFVKSNPKELEVFTEFVDRNVPFDVVVDGLNVAYCAGTRKSFELYASLLESVVKHFVTRNKKILILGRKHMLKWPRESMSFIKRNTHLFFTDNLSQDDPFLLYAALKSGQKTDFISKDLMRSHSFLLSNDTKLVFRRWQQQHQFHQHPKGNGMVIVENPFVYKCTAHKHNGYWHVPFDDQYMVNPALNFEMPKNWLCIKIGGKEQR